MDYDRSSDRMVSEHTLVRDSRSGGREGEIACPKCKAENPEQANFCVNCGERLPLVCPQCGTKLPLHAGFCYSGGTQVIAPPAVATSESIAERLQRLAPWEFAERLLVTQGQLPGQRRVVTILFSDVKGATPMTQHLDPEEVMEIMDGASDAFRPAWGAL